jgi:hypothetical protein
MRTHGVAETGPRIPGPVERVPASSGARGLFRARFAGLFLFAILLASSLLPGCSNPLATERDAFEENLQTWNAAAIDAYEFDYQLNCFCGGPGVRPVHIEVRSGVVVAVSFPDGGPPDSYDLADYPTIPDLFADVEASLARKPFSVMVEYDGALGYPRNFFADFVENAVDEELGFVATDLTPIAD